MKKVKKIDKILSVSHFDLDGVVCQIILKAVFKNIDFINAKFGEVEKHLEKTNFDKYDWIILTDIHPDDSNILNKSNKIILLDHHETATELNNPKNRRIVITTFCGAKLTKLFFEKYFKIDLSNFNKLIEYTNDYDMWIHEWRKSTHFNWLFGRYFPLRFRQEFKDGRTEFTNKEKYFLLQKEKQLKETINTTKIYEFGNTNICLVQMNDFLNESS